MSEFKVEDEVLWDDYGIHTVRCIGKNKVCVEDEDGDIYTVSPQYLRPYNPLKAEDVVEVEIEGGWFVLKKVLEINGRKFSAASSFDKKGKPHRSGVSKYIYSPDTVKLLYRPEETQ